MKLAESLELKTATTQTIVSALNVPDDVDVLFLLSVPNALKEMLLKSARLLVYTPSNEHFGIVPLEAMLAGVPVLAANTGGPLETIVEGKTGWLCDPTDVESWSAVMNKVLHKISTKELKKIGEAGVLRVKQEFSDVKMAERLDAIITRMEDVPRRSLKGLAFILAAVVVILFDGAYYVAVQNLPEGKPMRKSQLPPFALSALAVFSAGAYIAVGYAGTSKEDLNPQKARIFK